MQRVAKCHRQLRLYLRSPDASPETALICSILFYAFESLMGDCTSAMQHLNNGITLLKQYQSTKSAPESNPGSSRGSPTSPPPTTEGAGDDIMPHLASIFARLDIHASTFDDERMPILTLVSPEELAGTVHVVPTQFSSIDEGEVVLTRLQNWLMHHIIAHVAHKHKPLGEFPQPLLRERFIIYQQFERFFFALNMLFSSFPPEIPPRALLLRIQARMYYAILAENIPYEPQKGPGLGPFGYAPPSAMSNDSLRSTLADIQAFLSLDGLEDTSRNFTLSSQLIAILYFLCLKTVDPVNRETAFALLQHPRLPAKDGLWETGKAISIIRTLMEQTKANMAQEQSLEYAGDDVFSQDVGGIENVHRDLSTQNTEPPDRGL